MDSPHWIEAQNHIQNIKNNPFSRAKILNGKKMIPWLNLVNQLKEITMINTVNEKLKDNELEIHGIIVHENDNFNIEKIDIPSNCFID